MLINRGGDGDNSDYFLGDDAVGDCDDGDEGLRSAPPRQPHGSAAGLFGAEAPSLTLHKEARQDGSLGGPGSALHFPP